MTEREKRIAEMAKACCEDFNSRVCIQGTCGRIAICPLSTTACQRLYDAGYRKADEVRKEIFSKLIEVSKNFDGNLPLGVLKAWAIEYGVEVE